MLVRPRPFLSTAIVLVVFCCVYLLTPNRDAALHAASSGFSALTPFGGAAPPARAEERPYGRSYGGHSTPADINRVANGTLGFGRVLVVGLPERSDKRDAVALTAALTGFDVEWVDGVRGESVPDKAVPFGVDRKKLMETNLGSWRGHMNAVRRIVEEGLESALIMEDDMDWDVRLKPQLELIAAGARQIMADLPDTFFPTGRPSSSTSSTSTTPRQHQHQQQPPSSPYGDDWDLLWLGHCGEPFPEDLDENRGLAVGDPGRAAMARKYAILNDATVPPPGRATGLVDFGAHPPRTRWVHVSAAPICTFAYALSQRGARKVLYALSVGGALAGPFDNALAGLCRRAVGSWSGLARAAVESAGDGGGAGGGASGAGAGAGEGEGDLGGLGDRGLDAKCLSVTPPLFFHHKARGKIAGDSDIQKVGGGGSKGGEGEGEKAEEEGEAPPAAIREKGMTENIVWSARLNVVNMIEGSAMESQW